WKTSHTQGRRKGKHYRQFYFSFLYSRKISSVIADLQWILNIKYLITALNSCIVFVQFYKSHNNKAGLMETSEDLKQYNLISYILYILGFFLGVTPFIAIIMNYIKRDEMRGTWLESHVDWQIKTFWVSLLGYIVGGLLTMIL